MAMGDTACLMHAFSYTNPSSLPNEPHQGNPMNVVALGESVSFGRFTSESLSWEKWSTFSNNRYVEEAERYAQPGSVAQKKAFFEAHYKRIAAAKKAAALLQEATAGASTDADSQALITFDPNTADVQQPEAKMELNKSRVNRQESDSQSQGIKEAETTPMEIIVKDEIDSSTGNLQREKIRPGLQGRGTLKLEKPQLYVGFPPKKQTSNSTKSFDNQDDTTSASEHSGTPQIEKPLLKNFGSNRDRDAPSVNSKKKSAFSSFKSSIYPKTSKVPSPAKMTAPRIKKEHKTTTPITKKSTLKFMEKKESKKPQTTNYINSTPARTPERIFAPSNAKTPNSRVGSAAYRAFQACLSPLRTPNMAASAKMSKNVSATPQPQNARIKSPRDGSKTATPKWKILSAVCSNSLAGHRNKLQSPTVSTPFTLRTEERAARRKQKLEEKFNSKETPKVQLQTKIKEKAEIELRKLRRSFCFNARPPPNFSKQRETAENHMKKGTTTQPQSSKLGRKFSSSTISQPSCVSINKSCKSVNRNPTTGHLYSSSLTGATNHENTSPNIRF